MNLARPLDGIFRGHDGDVLRVLAGVNISMTGRHVHRLVGGGSSRTIQLALDRLAGTGLLLREEKGYANLYSFNRDHLAAPGILALLGMRASFAARVQEQLANWETLPLHVSLFGEFAAADEGSFSGSVDLLLVHTVPDIETDPWRRQVDELTEQVTAWTGNRVRAYEIDVDTFVALGENNPDLLTRIETDNRVLHGDRIPTLRHRLAARGVADGNREITTSDFRW